MSQLLLPGYQTSGSETGVRWTCASSTTGLCTPTKAPEAPFDSLLECQKSCRPQARSLRWQVTDSSTGTCRPTLDPFAEFDDALQCASSARAQMSPYPPGNARLTGWICSHPELNQCMETQFTDTPFSYKVYPTYEDCKNAPECTSAMNWYIDSMQNKCMPSTLQTAPFHTRKQCEKKVASCGYSGQTALQYTNPMKAIDSNWTEPYIGYRSDTTNPALLFEPPQIPLNPVDRPAVLGTHALAPGLAGQGYSIMG